jgi:hypothetical protein
MQSNTKSDDEVCASLASSMDGGGRPKLAPTRSEDSAALSAQSSGGSGCQMPAPALNPVPGRSAELNRRIATHEAGHAFVGRCMGTVLHSVSIIPGDGFEGRCRSTAYRAAFYEKPEGPTVEIVDLCERAQRLMPELGVNRVESAEFFQRSTVLAIELAAGTVAETILHPNETPLPTSHDQIEATAFASLAVASARAVPAFLAYCKAEAAALITDHLGAARAIADALVERGELSGIQVDEIITVAIAQEAVDAEKLRQRKWCGVVANAGRLRRVS